MTKNLYVQCGCGWDAPEGWLNFDASPTLRIERIPVVGTRISANLKGNPEPFPTNVQYGDIVKGLPLPDGSCAVVYCSHVLEHLSLRECRKALANTKRLLRPGGTFRFVLPDLQLYITRYEQTDGPDAALRFMKDTALGEEARNRGATGLARALLGNSKHRWMWDYPSLERELLLQGFREVRPAEFGDSVDPLFARVERRERWNECIGFECKV